MRMLMRMRIGVRSHAVRRCIYADPKARCVPHRVPVVRGHTIARTQLAIANAHHTGRNCTMYIRATGVHCNRH